ncbi:MAG: M23 family metallopeptidase, partial [Bacteroidales bacterium]|nr:M23 family metallopeptidase [Bacteroidales bacterium]
QETDAVVKHEDAAQAKQETDAVVKHEDAVQAKQETDAVVKHEDAAQAKQETEKVKPRLTSTLKKQIEIALDSAYLFRSERKFYEAHLQYAKVKSIYPQAEIAADIEKNLTDVVEQFLNKAQYQLWINKPLVSDSLYRFAVYLCDNYQVSTNAEITVLFENYLLKRKEVLCRQFALAATAEEKRAIRLMEYGKLSEGLTTLKRLKAEIETQDCSLDTSVLMRQIRAGDSMQRSLRQRLFRQPDDIKNPFIFPLKLKPEMAGSFCELRSNHFHGGVDYRTGQKEGYAVRAMAKGKIVRAAVTEKGYGKALYIQYDNGYQSVYGHLQKFSGKAEKFVRKEQKRTGSEYVNITGLDIPVKSKQKVAVSGNTGSSEGPHLHLEIRNSAVYESEVMLYNPQKYFSVKDEIAPKFHAVGIYNIKNTGHFTEVACGGNISANYYFTETLPDTLFLHSGNYGFGLSALDSMNDEPFHYGLYRLCFMIDKDTLAYYSLDAMPFSISEKAALHTDGEFYRRYKKRMEKSFIEPQNIVYSPYCIINNDGTYFLRPGTVYLLTITGSDYNGNTAVLRQWIKIFGL